MHFCHYVEQLSRLLMAQVPLVPLSPHYGYASGVKVKAIFMQRCLE